MRHRFVSIALATVTALGFGFLPVASAGAVPTTPTPPPTRTVPTTGWEVDEQGWLYPVSVGMPTFRTMNDAHWFGWDIARGVSASNRLGWGLVVDGWGALHPFWTLNNLPSITNWPLYVDGPYWPGWDIARDIALLPDGMGGLVLDGYGGLHPFVAEGHRAATVTGAPYWPGWDIARGVAVLPDGSGGYVLDAWGGLHPFGLDGHEPPPPATHAPYWRGWNIAQGVSFLADGSGGYVGDGWGGMHGFDVGPAATAPAVPTNGQYTHGFDMMRGITLAG